MIYGHSKFFLMLAETSCTRCMLSVRIVVFAVIIRHRY